MKTLPLTGNASRILLEGIVDYAGLFPPASVSMGTATRNFAHYRASGSGWMLGRFVCAANRLDEFSKTADALLPRDAGAIPWRLAVTASNDVAADVAAIEAFNTRHFICFDDRSAVVDAYEVKATSADAIHRIDATVPLSLDTYIETPLDADTDTLVEAIARVGRRAKMRMGGVTAEAFPTAMSVVRFLETCLLHDVTAKATAGLHHPICGAYRLTYDAEPPMGRMFGYLNVFLATALLAAGRPSTDAVLMLMESNPAAIEINDLHVAWHGPEYPITFDRSLLRRVRQQVLTSFGSCSFTEPLDESRTLGFL